MWETIGHPTADEVGFIDPTQPPDTIVLYKVSATDGTLVAPSEVQGGIANPDGNGDSDALNNADEVQAGYFAQSLLDGIFNAGEIRPGGNPLGWVGPDPKSGDTDEDSVFDHADGWANNPAIHPLRIPDTKYVVVDLEELGFPVEEETSNGYNTQTVPYQLNDVGQIIVAKYNDDIMSRAILFDLKTRAATDITTSDFTAAVPHMASERFLASRILNNRGEVCGSSNGRAAKWTHAAGVSVLADYHAPYLNGTSDKSYSSYASAINEAGMVAGGESQTGSVAANGPTRSESGGLLWDQLVLLGDHITSVDYGGPAVGGKEFYVTNVNKNGIAVGSFLQWVATGGYIPLRAGSSGVGIFDTALHSFGNYDENRIYAIDDAETPHAVGFGRKQPTSPQEPRMWINDNGAWTGHDLTAGIYGSIHRITERFELLGAGLLRNGKQVQINSGNNDVWKSVTIYDINNLGWAIGTASKADDHNQPDQLTSHPVLLLPVDLDVVYPATGELAEDKQHTGDGGYVPLKRADTTPVTKLVIRKSDAVNSMTGKFRLKFTKADRYEIYSDAARTIPIVTEQTEFTPNVETTLYLEGKKKSLTRGGEEIEMQVKIGTQWHSAEKIKATVVQSEFQFQVKEFIPYAWTEGEVEIPGPNALNPMNGKVAKGDGDPIARSFLNVFSDDQAKFSDAPFRVCQTIVITPYKELHSAADIEDQRSLLTAPLSEHFVKTTSVSPSEMSLHYGYINLVGTRSAFGKPPAGTPQYELIKRTDRVSEITVEGSGKDGVMPFGTTWATADIHWKLKLKISVDTDPLKPKVDFSGKHDSYPSYEIIVNQSDKTYKDIHRVAPAAGALPGPDSLSESNARTVGRTDTIED